MALKRLEENILQLEKSTTNMSPENVLKRGYSITRMNGKAVKTIATIKPEDVLHTIVMDGTIVSKVVDSKQ